MGRGILNEADFFNQSEEGPPHLPYVTLVGSSKNHMYTPVGSDISVAGIVCFRWNERINDLALEITIVDGGFPSPTS